MSPPPWFDVPLEDRVVGRLLAARLRDSADRPFLRFDEGSWTFAEVAALARSFARGLRAQGVKPGDHVVLALPNCPEFVFAWLGTSIAGAIIVPIDPRLTGALLDYMLTDATPRCLVVAQDLLPALATASTHLVDAIGSVVVVPAPGSQDKPGPQLRDRIEWQDMLIQSGPDPEHPVSGRDIAMVMYTSGSTGAPKGVIMTSAHTFSSGIVMVRGVALQPDDIVFAPLPLFHGMSSRIGVFPALVTGASVFIARRFSASGYWRQAAECGGTVGLVVPTMPGLLMAQPPSPFDRTHCLRALFNAPYLAGFDERFNTMLVESYGMTEISHVVSAALHERRPRSAGRVQPGWDVRLLDDAGKEVAPGEVGEVVARPHDRAMMLHGYLNKPGITAEAIRDGWFHTADYGHFEPDGYFYFSGRKAERIRKLGENISAQEIEGIVMSHPAVAECAALPLRAPSGDDDVRIVVVLAPGAMVTAAALHQWLQDKLPRFMMPRFIEFTGSLPRTESGKVAKPVMITAGLADTAWDSARTLSGAEA